MDWKTFDQRISSVCEKVRSKMSMPSDWSRFNSLPNERREFGRRKTIKPARLIVANRQPILAVVVDISLGGARIQLINVVDIPKQFDLEILEDNISIGCEVVHLGSNVVGVKFNRLPRRIRSAGAKEAARLTNLLDALIANGHAPLRND